MPKSSKPKPPAATVVKPIVGITSDYRPQNRDTFPLAWLNAGYIDSVSAAGGIPTALLPGLDEDDLRRVLQGMDGVVISGCRLDMDPVRLGFDPHPVTRAMPTLREDFERRVALLCYEMNIPVLAVGSGMQIMNVIAGGSLFQHIPEDVLRPLQHRDPVEKCLRHIIEIVPGTRLDQMYGPGEIRVNSDHHMAVDHLASCFRVCATAPDGVIEAYESTSDWFCLGVQWHPENQSASALDLQVFEAFVEAARPQTAAAEEPVILPFSAAA